MSSSPLWQKYQDWLYYHSELEFFMDVSRMNIDEALLEDLEPGFKNAFKDMQALEKGALANIDEGRRVGHFWLRAPEIAPDSLIRTSIQQDLENIGIFAKGLIEGSIKPPQADRFTDILSIGIGGSALGPQFITNALAPENARFDIHFIDNTDPQGIDRILNQIRDRLNSTLILEITKSGGTPEPRNGLAEVRHAFNCRGLSLPLQAVSISAPDSRMDQLAKSEGWLARFPLYEWIGGRTSVMSPVGLLPALLLGIDINLLLQGARLMDAATRVHNVRTNPAALLALSWYASGKGRGCKDMVVLPYKDSLLLFSRYLQQLVMESLGKERDLDGNIVHQGLAVYGNKGSTDQHAYVQQLREGIPNFFATFIEVLEDRTGPSIEVEPGITTGDYLSGFLHGTRRALYENQRESITLTIKRVNEQTVGALIALYERAVGLYASLINVNAFHQPGVEAGKAAAESLLQLQRRIISALESLHVPLSLEALAELTGDQDQIENLYMILRHLEANDRGIKLQGDPGKPATLLVSRH